MKIKIYLKEPAGTFVEGDLTEEEMNNKELKEFSDFVTHVLNKDIFTFGSRIGLPTDNIAYIERIND